MRAGSWSAFERKFNPIWSIKTHDIKHEYGEIKDLSGEYVWTMIEGDNGKWYAAPGFHFVNCTGYYIRCANPWSPADEMRDYLYF